ncbi:MAG: GNAT family N-acetyltransferase [Bacteroidetes bacterium]|nr:GNAT family N-acetyltransferase [Bacteroidota bacterium]
MRVVEVVNQSDRNEFLDFPSVLFKADKSFIRHLDIDIEAVFDDKSNRFLQFGEAKRWLLKSDDKTIGKIAAFYHKEKIDKPFCGLGFFDCINNQEAANILFKTGLDWLKSKGFSNALAPINFGDRDSFWGLLIDGYTDPSYRENYNSSYYQQLFENYGFIKDFEQTTSVLKRGEFNIERFSKLSTRVLSNPKYKFRHFEISKHQQFADDFAEIYNKAWQNHSFYRPMSVEQVRKQIKSLSAIAPEKLNWFVYADGKPAGFYINVLNINSIFKKSKGKFNLCTKLRFLFNKSKIHSIRGIVFGVIPEYHNLGLEVGMIMKTYEQLQLNEFKHIQETELSWVGDFNPKMLSMFESLGARVSKVHYTYKIEF